MDVVVFFSWLASFFSDAIEVVRAVGFTFHFVKAVFSWASATEIPTRFNMPKGNPWGEEDEEEGAVERGGPFSTVMEVPGAIKVVLDFLRMIFKISWSATPRSVAEAELQQLEHPEQSFSSRVAEFGDASKFTYGYVKDILKIGSGATPRTAAQAKWEQEHLQPDHVTSEGGDIGTLSELVDATKFTLHFVKGVFTVVAESTPPPGGRPGVQDTQDSGFMQTLKEIPESVAFVYHFVMAVIATVWSRPLVYTPISPQARQAQNLSSVAEVADASRFTLDFVKNVFRVAGSSEPRSIAQAKWDTAHPAEQEGLWAAIDGLNFVLDFLKQVFRTVWHADLPPEPVTKSIESQPSTSEEDFASVPEVMDAAKFSFSFVRAVIGIAKDSTPFSTAQADWNTAHKDGIVKEVGDSSVFVFDFVKDVFRTTWSTNLPSQVRAEREWANLGEVVDSARSVLDWVCDVIKLGWNSKLPEEASLLDAIYDEVAEILDTFSFVANFVKAVFRLAAKSKLPDGKQETETIQSSANTSQGFGDSAKEAVGAFGFVLDFLKGVFKLAFKSKLPGSESTIFHSIPVITDSVNFVLGFLAAVMKMAFGSSLPGDTSSPPVKQEGGVIAGAVELADILWAVADFIKDTSYRIMTEDLPPPQVPAFDPEPTTPQASDSSSNEFTDAITFVFNFIKGLFKMAWGSKVPYATALSNWEKEHPDEEKHALVSPGEIASPAEILSSLNFVAHFIKEVISLVIRSTPASAYKSGNVAVAGPTEVASTFAFVVDFVKAVIEMGMRSTPASAYKGTEFDIKTEEAPRKHELAGRSEILATFAFVLRFMKAVISISLKSTPASAYSSGEYVASYQFISRLTDVRWPLQTLLITPSCSRTFSNYDCP